jgi:coenzyme Q-binding protein COQ10
MRNGPAHKQSMRLAVVWKRDYANLTDTQAYTLVADIESYPGFVPGCIATHMTKCGDRHWQVENVFGFGPVRARFRSIAKIDPPRSIRIESTDGPWRRFLLTWQFEARDGGCHVTCACESELRSSFLTRVARSALPTVETLIIGAFEARLRRLSATQSGHEGMSG